MSTVSDPSPAAPGAPSTHGGGRLAAIGGGLLLAVGMVVLMLWLAGMFHHRVQPGGPTLTPAPGPAGATAAVEARRFPLVTEQVGTLHTQVETSVASHLLAQVVALEVRAGNAVSGPGDDPAAATVLARLDDREVQARLAQARAQVRMLESAAAAATAQIESAKATLAAAAASRDEAAHDFTRVESLVKSQIASAEQLDTARARRDVTAAQLNAATQQVRAAELEVQRLQAQHDEAEAAVKELTVTLSYTVLRAPFSGRVTRTLVEVGDMVSPGQALLQLETPAAPELQAVVAESLLPHLTAGQALTVHIDALARDLAGTVREIVPLADPVTRTVLVKVSLPAQADLVSGFFGRLQIPVGDYEALLIPQHAVQTAGQVELVEVVAPDGQRERRFITTGQVHGEWVEVLSGLKAGEVVMVPQP